MPRASGPPEATPQFIGAITQLKRLARGSDFLARQAKAVLERVDKAIVKLDKDYCAGSRLRGPGLTEICEVRLAGGWRVLYKVNPQKKVPVSLMVGQHYRDISVTQGRRQDRAAARRPLVQALGWGDLYQTLIGEQQLSEAQLRQMIQAVQREVALSA